MQLDKRTLLYDVVKQYVSVEAPSRVEELELVFPALFKAIEDQPIELVEAQALPHNGLPFDFSGVADATLAIVVFIGAQILNAAAKATAKDELPKLFDTVSDKLVALTRRPTMVAWIRRRLQRTLEEL